MKSDYGVKVRSVFASQIMPALYRKLDSVPAAELALNVNLKIRAK